MDKESLTKAVYTIQTTTERDGDDWKSTTVFSEVAFFGEEKKEESISSMCVDSTVESAVNTSTKSVLSFIVENVYARGFSGLIEYYEFERNLKEKKDDNEA